MEAQNNHEYIGKELELFSNAKNWAHYLQSQIKPYLHGTVIEVGAGIGSRTEQLCQYVDSWIAVEPDYEMWQRLTKTIESNQSMKNVQAFHGTLKDLPKNLYADAILYIDVLEHIKNDQQELLDAKAKLNSMGFLVVLSPAHQWLYSKFDQSIGHWRRYSLKRLLDITPIKMKISSKKMLDSVGMFASLANKLILKKNMPTRRQISFWDKFLVRASKYLDPLIAYSLGKSVLVVWQKID